mgnify:FL=1
MSKKCLKYFNELKSIDMKKFFVLTVIAFFTLSLSAQNKFQKQDAKPVKKEEVKEKKNGEKLPEITFEKMVYDYGEIVQGADGTCYFEFKNTGRAALILTNCSSSCGCTVPTWPKDRIAPGDKGKIKVTYNTQRLGAINKAVYVDSNVGTRVTLKITGNVSPAPKEAVPQNNTSPMYNADPVLR